MHLFIKKQGQNGRKQQTLQFVLPLFFCVWNFACQANKLTVFPQDEEKRIGYPIYGRTWAYLTFVRSAGNGAIMKKEFQVLQRICLPLKGIKGILTIKYLLKTAVSIMDILLILLIGFMLEAIWGKEKIAAFGIAICLYVGLFSLKCLLEKYYLLAGNQLQEKITLTLTGLLFKKTMKAKAKEIQKMGAGDLQHIFRQDIQELHVCISGSMENITVSILRILAVFVIISCYSAFLAIAVLILSTLTVFLTGYTRKKYQTARTYFRKQQGEYVDWISEHLKGIKDIRRNCAQKMVTELFEKRTDENLKEKERIRFIEIRADRIVSCAGMLFNIVFWTISFVLILKGKLSVGIFYVVNEYLKNLIESITAVGQENINIRNSCPAFERIEALLQLEQEEDNGNGERREKENSYAELVFENVEFGYGSEKVVHNISYRFSPGIMYVMTGKNGAGKTTFMDLLLRFYEYQGKILYGGKEIREYPLGDWRKRIGYVQQKNIIFEGSLRDNILFYAPETDEDTMWECLKAADMFSTVKEWKEGLDTGLQRGERLSEGQRQRIAIARVLTKDPQIILMDEPTASLDRDTEEAVITRIKELCREHPNKIWIVVTHEMRVIKKADKVILMRKGTLCDYGE